MTARAPQKATSRVLLAASRPLSRLMKDPRCKPLVDYFEAIIDGTNAHLGAAQAEAARLTDAVADLQRNLAERADANRRLFEEHNTAVRERIDAIFERDGARERARARAAELDEAEAEVARLAGRVAAVEVEIAAKAKTNQNLSDECGELRNNLALERIDHRAKSDQLDIITSRNADIEAAIALKAAELSVVCSARDDAVRRLANAEKVVAFAQRSFDEAQALADRRGRALEALTMRLGELEAARLDLALQEAADHRRDLRAADVEAAARTGAAR